MICLAFDKMPPLGLDHTYLQMSIVKMTNSIKKDIKISQKDFQKVLGIDIGGILYI